jgi:polyhydroxyalkanoate synthesis regulator protein
VTVSDIRNRILEGEIVRTRGGDDITSDVLICVIRADHEKRNGPTADQLRQFIKHYSAPKSKRAA